MASKMIGPAGGELAIGIVTIVVPPGALTSPQTLSVKSVSSVPTEYAAYSALFRFEPEGLEFLVPITVKFSVSEKGSSPLAVFWSARGSQDTFVELPSSTNGDFVTTQTSHFSTAFVATSRVDDASLRALDTDLPGFEFSPDLTMRSIDVPRSRTSLTLKPAAARDNAKISIDGTVVSPGTSVVVSLTGDTTVVTVLVEGASTSRTYSLAVNRRAAVQMAKFKPLAPADQRFGFSVAVSADGNTVAVGALNDKSNATGINGNETDDSLPDSGAVHVYVKTGSVWLRQAYVKASNAGAGDVFGVSVALSADGNTLVVGASNEASSGVGVDANQLDNSDSTSGAVYIFTRAGATWSQQAYLKSPSLRSFPGSRAYFGQAVSLSGDGDTLAVGAADYVNGVEGFTYVFRRTAGRWATFGQVQGSGRTDRFGNAVSLSADGSALAVGARWESSSPDDTTTDRCGAAYVFEVAMPLRQLVRVAPRVPVANMEFGSTVVLSGDGNTLVVGAPNESGGSTGVGGTESDGSRPSSGAAYVFRRAGGVWGATNYEYLKASNTGVGDHFGSALALSFDGSALVVGAPDEASRAVGIDGDQADNSVGNAGAAYIFARSPQVWSQQAYVKGDTRNFSAGLALSRDGLNLVVGAPYGGAAYVFAR
jgi:hypothetical protein